MPSDRENENGGILRSLLQIHKTLTRIEFVIVPIIVAVGVAAGFYHPIVGFGTVGILAFFAWIYFDAKKHLSMRNPENPDDGD
jgi:hypothetical protein